MMKERDRLSELESFLSEDARAFRKSAIRAFGRITSDPKVTMRLTFAKEPDDRMRDGIARLAAVLFGS